MALSLDEFEATLPAIRSPRDKTGLWFDAHPDALAAIHEARRPPRAWPIQKIHKYLVAAYDYPLSEASVLSWFMRHPEAIA